MAQQARAGRDLGDIWRQTVAVNCPTKHEIMHVDVHLCTALHVWTHPNHERHERTSRAYELRADVSSPTNVAIVEFKAT